MRCYTVDNLRRLLSEAGTTLDPEAKTYFRYMLLQETLHLMGGFFNSPFGKIDSKTGRPMQNTTSFLLETTDSTTFGKTRVQKIMSPTVLRKAAEQFGCTNSKEGGNHLDGVPLEDDRLYAGKVG